MNEKLKQYAELTNKIRELSAPYVSDVKNGEEYYERLVESFNEIRRCADLNEGILLEEFYPLMEERRELTEDELQLIRDFSEVLIMPESMESIDLPIFYLQTVKMLEDAGRKEDLRLELQALDNLTMAAYAMLMVTLRLYPSFDIVFKYRDIGYDSAEKILYYLEPSRFEKLPDAQCKEAVLINSRYISAFFEWADKEDFTARVDKDIEILERSLKLADDPFYLEQAPDYDWGYHKFRCLEYMTNLHEYRMHERFNPEQLNTVMEYTEKMVEFLSENEDYRHFCTPESRNLYLTRNSYLAGKISLDEHMNNLKELIGKRRMEDFAPDWVHFNFMVYYEFLCAVKIKGFTREDKDLIISMNNELIKYIYKLPRMGVMSFLLTCLSGILRNFQEFPGELTMEDMVVELMAALHPPTYVHSLNVADITKCLTEHLLEKDPGAFVGAVGTTSAEEVLERKGEILEHAYKTGLLHDVGKLFITETIITYGRRLLIAEFDLIKAHPDTGADLMEMHESTAPYAYGARGHHCWYDGSAGYPAGFSLENKGEKTILDVLTVADCLDASTDSIGRNYKKGKSIEEYAGELREGRGTQYAPDVVDLFEDPEIYAELSELLKSSRNRNYGRAFELLKELGD